MADTENIKKAIAQAVVDAAKAMVLAISRENRRQRSMQNRVAPLKSPWTEQDPPKDKQYLTGLQRQIHGTKEFWKKVT